MGFFQRFTHFIGQSSRFAHKLGTNFIIFILPFVRAAQFEIVPKFQFGNNLFDFFISHNRRNQCVNSLPTVKAEQFANPIGVSIGTSYKTKIDVGFGFLITAEKFLSRFIAVFRVRIGNQSLQGVF